MYRKDWVLVLVLCVPILNVGEVVAQFEYCYILEIDKVQEVVELKLMVKPFLKNVCHRGIVVQYCRHLLEK